MATKAIRLRLPAIAAGFRSMDLIRTPPRDQSTAAARRSNTCLFNRSSGVQEFRSSGVQEFRSSGVQEFSLRLYRRAQAFYVRRPFEQ
jgi:hypothetical protein